MPLSDARTRMIARAAREIAPGMVVNLGIGMPTQVVNHLAADYPVCLHTENGMTGVGPVLPPEQADRNLIDAGGAYVSTVAGSAFFDSATSFAMVRSGRLDLTMLGAFEVAANGDLANWMIPGKLVKGMGGAMDLVAGVGRVIVIMDHANKKGESKLLKECTLPLTGKGCIKRVLTDLALMDIEDGKFVLRERAPGVSVEQIKALTEGELVIPANVPEMTF